MNKDIFEGKWDEVKGKMKQAWGKLTDNDLKVIEGNHQECAVNYKKLMATAKKMLKKPLINLEILYNRIVALIMLRSIKATNLIWKHKLINPT